MIKQFPKLPLTIDLHIVSSKEMEEAIQQKIFDKVRKDNPRGSALLTVEKLAPICA